jgi:hypothetical protein
MRCDFGKGLKMRRISIGAAILMASGVLLADFGASNALAGNAGRSAPASGPTTCRGMTTGTPGCADCLKTQQLQQQAQQQQQQQQNKQGAESK